MKKITIILFSLFVYTITWAQTSLQNPQAYILYDKDGNKVEYSDMIAQMSQMDVVFLGEIHTCTIAHWMEKLIIKDLHTIHGDKLMLGAEMFERDNQVLVNEYLEGLIPESKFKAEVKLWDNYTTDYAPILEYAKKNKLPFIATNVARRYASMVAKGGFEALDKVSEEARLFIAPLPIKYIPNKLVDKYFADMMKPKNGTKDMKQMPKTDSKNMKDMKAMKGMKAMPTAKFSEAQAVKDATMAWSISQNIKDKFIHINGSFHSTGHAGILSYLNVYRPGLKMGTIEIVRQEDISSLSEESKGKADFFICVPESMTSSYHK